MDKLRKLPIGIDNFQKLITSNYYYVDKTMMINEILEAGSEVTLITRPRRFGKTLNMSMLKYFFEDTTQLEDEEDSYAYLFDNLKISAQSCMKEQGGYPVIDLTFKECKLGTWEKTFYKIKEVIQNEYERHEYVLENSNLSSRQKKMFVDVLDDNCDELAYTSAIVNLSKILSQHYKKSCIILLDEYDVPLQNAHVEGFYDRAIEFIRSLFSSTFKQNRYMKFGVITGCLRIGKESIFTGWNNVDVQTVIGDLYLSDFGITVAEKDKLLREYNLQYEDELIKKWYDGYNFGGVEIYNPWDLLNYVRNKKINSARTPQSYWIGTSGNDILQELLETKNSETQKSIKLLIADEEIDKKISESLTYGYLKSEPENVWSILLFTGYLTGRLDVEKNLYKLRIPNKSIRQCYIEQIENYNNRQLKPDFADKLEQHLVKGEGEKVSELLNEYLNSTLSYYDDLEAFYHGLVTGICSAFPHYKAESNKEAGTGRADIILRPIEDDTLPGIILEFKWKKSDAHLDVSAQEGFNQIKNNEYCKAFGINVDNVRKYGIAFSGKKCSVAWKKATNKKNK